MISNNVKKHLFYLTTAVFIAGFLCLTACSDDETDIGLELQDPSTFFDGVTDTVYGVAYTVFDDSLITSGQSSALVGCYQDNVFGTSEAVIYTMVTSPNGEGVEFDQYCNIDSVVLSLNVASIYGDNSKSYHNLHFEIYQLADTIDRDTTYLSTQTIDITNTCFFNKTVRMADADTMVASLKLNPSFIALLSNHTYATADDFAYAIKGLRIRLVNDGKPVMATINLAAAATRLTAYYTYNNGNDSIYRSFEFEIGSAPHFNHYTNNYIGSLSTFNSNHNDSVEGSRYLYLSPMGGTNVLVNFNSAVQQFKQQQRNYRRDRLHKMRAVAGLKRRLRVDRKAAADKRREKDRRSTLLPSERAEPEVHTRLLKGFAQSDTPARFFRQ